MASRNSGLRNPANRQGLRNVSEKHSAHLEKVSRIKELIPLGNEKQSIPSNLRRLLKGKGERLTYVLDTNVLLTAWDALFKFEEHDVCLVSQVWQELDKHKKGHSDEAWNTRKAIRIIDALVAGKTSQELKRGIPLIPPSEIANGKAHTGRLFFDFSKPRKPDSLDIDLSLDEPDDRIILICLALKKQGKHVVLISNDGNCRVKAGIAGIEAEEYLNEAVTGITSEEDIRTGFHKMPKGFWNTQDKSLKPVRKGKIFSYTLSSSFFRKVNCNEFLIFEDGLKLMVVDKPKGQQVVAETFVDYCHRKVSNITPRNIEQEFALQLLMDERVPAVSLAGLAGSGKTYLALGAAIHQTYDLKMFNRILITRATIGSDEDIGFLPGTEEEKMSPWMGAVYDNLEIFTGENSQEENETEEDRNIKRQATADFLGKRIQIRSLNFMKGRTFNKTFLIVDETQDLTAKKLKMIATRLGSDSKVVFLGNVAQIDDNYLTENTCGLSIFIRAFADSKLAGHITLQRGERGPFATEAEMRL